MSDYYEVENLEDGFLLDPYLDGELSHLKRQWTEGFSVQEIIPWCIGDLIVFDAQQVHCSSNFINSNINKKLGLSIFIITE